MAWRRQRLTPRRPAAGGARLSTSYYRSGAAGPNTPFEKSSGSRRLKKTGWLLLNLVIIGLLLAGIFYSLIVKSSPKLAINNQIYHPAGVYQAVAADKLKSLKNHNKISLDEQSIINSLQTKFPEIASASLELPVFSSAPLIHLTISPPSILLDDGSSTYIVDEEGVAVAPAAELPRITNLAKVVDHSGFRVSSGRPVLAASSVAFIKVLTSQCKLANVPIESLELPKQAQEINLRTSDRGYYVKFFLGGDPVRQTGQFLAARHQFDQATGQPAEYLDVRVSGKIYYK